MEFLVDLGYSNRKEGEWNEKDKTHFISLFNSILLNICSYIDEYNLNFLHISEPEFKNRIIDVKRIAKPAFKKIGEWTDLHNYRNHMIAHNFRIDGNEFSFNNLGQYNAPRTYRDLVMLRKHLVMISTIIEAEFEIEKHSLNSFINSFPVKEQQISYETVEQDLIDVLNQINSLCETNSKPYKLTNEMFMRL
jgi:hypothetical protein